MAGGGYDIGASLSGSSSSGASQSGATSNEGGGVYGSSGVYGPGASVQLTPTAATNQAILSWLPIVFIFGGIGLVVFFILRKK